MRYRRSKALCSSFFFTAVTFDRRKIFTLEQTIALLRRAIDVVRVPRTLKVRGTSGNIICIGSGACRTARTIMPPVGG